MYLQVMLLVNSPSVLCMTNMGMCFGLTFVSLFFVFFIYLAALSKGVGFFFFLGGGVEAPYLPVQFSSCLCVWPTSAQCLMNRWNRGIHARCAGSGWLRLPVTCADFELLFEGQDQQGLQRMFKRTLVR